NVDARHHEEDLGSPQLLEQQSAYVTKGGGSPPSRLPPVTITRRLPSSFRLKPRLYQNNLSPYPDSVCGPSQIPSAFSLVHSLSFPNQNESLPGLSEKGAGGTNGCAGACVPGHEGAGSWGF